ncbi:MAG: bifunctional MaoC family dehydratase N-terminal/OB-fold nucleic acid binding domain-containing protein [Actinomycetes bacterium]
MSLLDQLRAFEGRVVGPPTAGPDEVNQAMIRHWCEAVGDANPVYTDPAAAAKSVHHGIVAPPTMLQAWVMRGLNPPPAGSGNAQDELLSLLTDAGFSSVVATNCEQTYERYLRPGDRVTVTASIESVSEEKKTGLGVGHFVTTRQDYHDAGGDLVASMTFRILKFRPPEKMETKPLRPRPAVTQDSEFWFEGAKQHKLLIQRCVPCGRLRHPPGPVCPRCTSYDWDTVEASGRGTVYSFVVNHYPQVPAFDYPLSVGLIELQEGTRLVADIIGVEAAEVEVGMPVQAEFVAVDDDLTLPMFRPVA